MSLLVEQLHHAQGVEACAELHCGAARQPLEPALEHARLRPSREARTGQADGRSLRVHPQLGRVEECLDGVGGWNHSDQQNSRLFNDGEDEDAHGYVHVHVYVYVHEGRAYGPLKTLAAHEARAEGRGQRAGAEGVEQ